jgi:hypothetical protein
LSLIENTLKIYNKNDLPFIFLQYYFFPETKPYHSEGEKGGGMQSLKRKICQYFKIVCTTLRVNYL